MKLYYSPGACSLAPHIILRETGLPFSLERVDLRTHKLANGDDYYKITSRGQVPLLELEDGQRLTEGPVIAQYIAEQAGRDDLIPSVGNLARYRVLEWQNFITSELHKGFSPLFGTAYPEEAKPAARQVLRSRFEWVDGQLVDGSYLTGETFTVADAYLYTVTGWVTPAGVDISDLAALIAYRQRVEKREAVLEALREEGLKK